MWPLRRSCPGDRVIAARKQAGVRGNGLPSTLAPHKRVGEPNDHIVGRAFDFSNAVRATRHNRRISKKAHIHVVDLNTMNPVQASLEDVGKDAGSVPQSAIRASASPVVRDDPLDRCSVGAHPSFRQRLLQLRQQQRVFPCTGPLVHTPGGQARHHEEEAHQDQTGHNTPQRACAEHVSE